MDLKKKSLLRRYPLITVLALMFFALSVIVIVALQAGASPSVTDKRPRKKVNTYRLPADFNFVREAIGLVAQSMGPILTGTAPEAVIDGGRSNLLFNIVTMVLAVFAGLLIGWLMTRLPLH
ncbi:MAG: hypothetical protein ACYCXF_07500 [Thermoleophilia bacterium]